MSDHTTALVPLESWCYNSPELRANGTSVDLGLLAEALIYYDTVLFSVANPPQFAELLSWFIAQNKYEDFLALVNDGVLKVYDYAFATGAVGMPDGTYRVMNIQDTIQARPDTFEKRVLYHEAVQSCLQNARQRARLYRTIRDNVIEVKADEFGKAVENATQDYLDANRQTIIIQAFVDELYAFRKLGKPPDVTATVVSSPDGHRNKITWNVDLNELQRIAGKELNFHLGTPFTAAALSN